MLPRPRFRLPLWAALAIPGAAYLMRALLMRNGDFTPDLPGDMIVAAILAAGIILVAIARRNGEKDPDRQAPEDDV